ncbi:MFS transporter [Rhodohalobacter sp. 614A]|uniref:MFS transporter n=1 Tax=Rhodohalobacter sp. 614A TaxID=2908649 RepID=UPI001F23C9DF|nr:MFS transporter [Rhodohalobacter sp. 614A]
MTKSASFQKFAPVMISFYIMGFVDLVGVATGYVQKDFSLSDSVAQLLPSMVFVWFALISLPTGIFQDRKSKKLTLSIGIFVTGAGLLIPFLIYTYPAVVLGFCLLGIGNTILQVSANPLLIDISTKSTQSANLSFSQFVKASAALLSPIFIAILVRTFGDWRLIFPIYAAISILIAIWLLTIKIEEKKSEKPPATFRSVLRLLKEKMVIILVLGIFLIVGFDVGMNSNIAIFLTSRFDLDLATAGFGISVYFASLMVGRFSGGILLRYITERNFIIVSLLLTFIGLAGIIMIPILEVTWAMIFLTGLGFSNIFPLLFSIAINRMPDYANEVSGLIILSVSGGAVIPPLMGYVNQNFGNIAPIFVLAGCMLYVSYAAMYMLAKDTEKI